MWESLKPGIWLQAAPSFSGQEGGRENALSKDLSTRLYIAEVTRAPSF